MSNIVFDQPDIPIPPSSITSGLGGSGRFLEIGEEYAHSFVDLGRLGPDHTILDVGCGCGRMAFPLVGYLRKGRYFGIDVDAAAIAWAKENISERYPNFVFESVDAHHVAYNPDGSLMSEKLTFPIESESVDLVTLVSVFTHLRPSETNHYLSEIRRVLKPGGRVLVTGFLLNCEVLLLHQLDKWRRREEHRMPSIGVGGAMLSDSKVVYAVYWDEACLLGLFKQNGLTPNLPVVYGSWCGREAHSKHSQDVIVATK